MRDVCQWSECVATATEYSDAGHYCAAHDALATVWPCADDAVGAALLTIWAEIRAGRDFPSSLQIAAEQALMRQGARPVWPPPLEVK